MTTPTPTAELQAAIRYFQNLINTHRAVAGCCRCARCKVYEFTIAALSQSSEAQRAVEALEKMLSLKGYVMLDTTEFKQFAVVETVDPCGVPRTHFKSSDNLAEAILSAAASQLPGTT